MLGQVNAGADDLPKVQITPIKSLVWWGSSRQPFGWGLCIAGTDGQDTNGTGLTTLRAAPIKA